MNYDSIILELLSRVQTLEQKVNFLEGNSLKPQEIVEDLDEQDEENRITRSTARQYIMDKIARIYPFLDVQKGNRASRADIIMTFNSGQKKGMPIHAKFYYSKSYLDFHSGWHTVKKSDLNNDNLDLHIFTVSYNNVYRSVLFSQEHLRQYVQKKPVSSADVYYFYFHLTDDMQVESRDGERDVSANFDDWDLIGQIANTKQLK